jgi:hypothetical protein
MKELQAKGRSFSSFNTPENIRWEREWDKAFPKPPGVVTYRNPLPAYYQIKKEQEKQ